MAKSVSMKTVGRNIDYRMEGTKLIIEIDTTQKGELSKSGKTMNFATTQGNKRIDDFFLGLNVYRYADKKDK